MECLCSFLPIEQKIRGMKLLGKRRVYLAPQDLAQLKKSIRPPFAEDILPALQSLQAEHWEGASDWDLSLAAPEPPSAPLSLSEDEQRLNLSSQPEIQSRALAAGIPLRVEGASPVVRFSGSQPAQSAPPPQEAQKNEEVSKCVLA